jgi:hypothetical protein
MGCREECENTEKKSKVEVGPYECFQQGYTRYLDELIRF